MMAKTDERDEDRPMSGKAAGLSLVLGFVALGAFSAAFGAAGALIFDPGDWGPGNWKAVGMIAALVPVGVGAVWGIRRLRPLAGIGGPVSPRTRKAEGLFALSGLVAIPGVLALMAGTFSKDAPFAFFSNSPVSPTIAIVAIAGWLLSMLISWQWYRVADEHERQAADIGNLAGLWLFMIVTPVWWVAARGGLLPAPDAMILWVAVVLAGTVGWFWRHYR